MTLCSVSLTLFTLRVLTLIRLSKIIPLSSPLSLKLLITLTHRLKLISRLLMLSVRPSKLSRLSRSMKIFSQGLLLMLSILFLLRRLQAILFRLICLVSLAILMLSESLPTIMLMLLMLCGPLLLPYRLNSLMVIILTKRLLLGLSLMALLL